jgi:hypothetical protein
MTRNEVYPGMTRAVTANHGYLDTGGGGGDPHQVITPESVTPQTINEIFAEMIGRDGSNRSATTEQREAAEPARRLGQAADAYQHCIVAGAETLIGPAELARITAGAEQDAPGITTAPAWETLRGHLAVLAADGHDPITALTAAAAHRELDTARDVAAVLDYRLDPTGNHSQQPGPLPWLPAVPSRLTEPPDWAAYLTARADHVRDLADRVRADAETWAAGDAPGWSGPYLHNPGLVGDLAVWRAAESVDPADPRPAGPKPRRIAMITRHTALAQRCVRAAGDPTDGADRWAAVLTRIGITDVPQDDYWPVLVGRLTLADTAGLPVPVLLADAAGQGPLPTENPAAALWWRLAPHLGAVTTITTATGTAAAHRVRPAWTTRLEDILGRDVTEAVTTDRLWPVLVARVDTATAAGIDPTQLIFDAAGMLAGNLDTLRPHQYATVLLLHVSTLADPEPLHPDHALDPGVDFEVPPDPADQDLLPPPDLHEHHPAAARGVVDDGQLGVPGPPVEPVDDTTAPEDPQVLVTVAPDPEVDTAALDRAREAVAAAWDFYRQQAARSWVPGYLTGRGLDPGIAGYAPAGWTRLVDHLRTQGFTDTEMLAAGLARTGNDDRVIDRFSNRVMLPIHDADGTVIAFVGRKHPADTNPAAPKYVNSPTTDLFRKTDLPYGLTTDTTGKLRAGADLVLVEGPMDAHAVTTAAAATGLHLVAVAPLGTALTAEQLATLDGIGPLTDRRVIVALDNDPAGIKAARSAFRLLAEAGVGNPDTITLPAGGDPAQLLADHGPAALAAALTHRRPLVDLVVDDITGYWLGRITPGGWGIEEGFHALQEAAPIIARLPEPDRNRQAERLADTIGFDPFTVLDTIERHVPYTAELVGELQLPQPPKLRTRTEKSATDSELSFADRLARATTGRARSAADQDTTDSELSFADRLARAMNPELDAPEHRPAEQTVAQGHDAYGPQRRPEQDHGRGHRL